MILNIDVRFSNKSSLATLNIYATWNEQWKLYVYYLFSNHEHFLEYEKYPQHISLQICKLKKRRLKFTLKFRMITMGIQTLLLW